MGRSWGEMRALRQTPVPRRKFAEAQGFIKVKIACTLLFRYGNSSAHFTTIFWCPSFYITCSFYFDEALKVKTACNVKTRASEYCSKVSTWVSVAKQYSEHFSFRSETAEASRQGKTVLCRNYGVSIFCILSPAESLWILSASSSQNCSVYCVRIMHITDHHHRSCYNFLQRDFACNVRTRASEYWIHHISR